MGRRGVGRRLNDQERMEILDIMAREAKVKNVDLARRYGVSEGAIRKLKQMKDTIRDRYYLGNEQSRDQRKRGGFARNAPFEQELYEWICRMRENQAYQMIPLTQSAVRQQAMILAKKYEWMANFKASPGWFARFCSRHRLDPGVQQPSNLPVLGGSASSSTVATSSAHGPVPTSNAAEAAVAAAAAAASLPMSFQSVDGLTFTETLAQATKVDMEVDLNCPEAMEEQVSLARQNAMIAAIKSDMMKAELDAHHAQLEAVEEEMKAKADHDDADSMRQDIPAPMESPIRSSQPEAEPVHMNHGTSFVDLVSADAIAASTAVAAAASSIMTSSPPRVVRSVGLQYTASPPLASSAFVDAAYSPKTSHLSDERVFKPITKREPRPSSSLSINSSSNTSEPPANTSMNEEAPVSVPESAAANRQRTMAALDAEEIFSLGL